MTKKRKGEPGRLRWRLSELLEVQGIIASAYALIPAQGYWRSSPFADVYRWEGVGTNSLNQRMMIDSWDTMGDCVKYGITIEKDGFSLLVHANKGV